MIKLIKVHEDGTIHLSEVEFKKLLHEVYQEGYKDGQAIVRSEYYDKYEKIPYWQRPDYRPPITCTSVTDKDIPITAWGSQRVNTYYTLEADTSM